MYDRQMLTRGIVDILVEERACSAAELARRLGGREAVYGILEGMADRGIVTRDGTRNMVSPRTVTVILKIYRQGGELVAFSGSGELLLRRPMRTAAALSYEQNAVGLFADVSKYVKSLTGYDRIMTFLCYDGFKAPTAIPSVFRMSECRETLISQGLERICGDRTLLYFNRESDTAFLSNGGTGVTEARSIGKSAEETLKDIFKVAKPYAVVVEGGLHREEEAVRKACIGGNVKMIKEDMGHPLRLCEREALKRLLVDVSFQKQ